MFQFYFVVILDRLASASQKEYKMAMNRMKFLIKMKWTAIGFFIGLLYWIAHLFVDIDLSELVVGYVQQLERYEFDELLVLFFVTFLGLLKDLSRHSKAEKQVREAMEQKLYTVHATVATLEDLLGNKLVSLKMLTSYLQQQKQMTAKNYDEMAVLIQDSLDCLRQLHNLTVLHEQEDSLGLLRVDLDKEDRSKVEHHKESTAPPNP